MSTLRQTIRADVNRHLDEETESRRARFAAIRHNEGLQAVLVYRLGRELLARRRSVLAWPLLALGWPLYALLYGLMRACYGIRLSLTADIAPGFYIGHFGGVEVYNCRLGQRCSIGAQTKIGRRDEPAGPSIGAGVWIGAHAKIYGAKNIGDNATIAPGARVQKNIPENALVVGDPGRIVFRGYQTERIVPGT